MGWRALGALMLVVCACQARLAALPDDSRDGVDASVAISVPDGADADVPLGPWSAAIQVPAASTPGGEDDGGLSSNGLEMVFALREPGDNNRKHLYYMSRPDTMTDFSMPMRLPFNVTGSSDEGARFSANDLTLYFGSGRAGGSGNIDVWEVTRPSIGGAWGMPSLVAGVNTTGTDKWYTPCGDHYVMSRDSELAEGEIGSAPTLLTDLNSNGEETGVYLTRDCLTLYFASTRSGAYKIYRSQRPATPAPWKPAAEVTDFAAAGGAQSDPWMSPDQRTFLFTTNVAGNDDIYISTR